jgi:hypothetical protein
MTTVFNIFQQDSAHEENRFFPDKETALREARESSEHGSDVSVYAIKLTRGLKPAQLACLLLERSGYSEEDKLVAKFRGGKKVRRKVGKLLEGS